MMWADRISCGLLALGVAAAAAACGASAPVAYQGDDTHWEVALLDARTPELVVEGTLHGQGPYLFVLDPDAPGSVIDDRVARELGLYSNHRYVRIVNQRDVSVPRKFYEVLALDVGDLHIRNVKMLNAPAGSLVAGGRQVHGILGSDLLSRTIVVGMDRDAARVALSLTGHASVPAAAASIRGWLHYGSFYVPMKIGNRTLTMQVRLASSVSTLRAGLLSKLSLGGFPGQIRQVDETGTAAELSGGGIASVELDGLTVDDVRFYRHVDRRERLDFSYDGIIGQDILSRFHAVVDRDHKVLYLAQRSPLTTASR